jgi:hypothetical protein
MNQVPQIRVCVGFILNKVTLGMYFSKYICVYLSVSFQIYSMIISLF